MFDGQRSYKDKPAVGFSHPPKPRLTLRVGVTGHRSDKLSEMTIEAVERRLRDVFAAIEASSTKILADNADFFADGSPVFRLVSGFAEGSDRIAVAMRPAGWHVEALLPFPRREFATDFAPPG